MAGHRGGVTSPSKTFGGALQRIYVVTCLRKFAKLRHFTYNWLRPQSLSTPGLESCLHLVGDKDVSINKLCV